MLTTQLTNKTQLENKSPWAITGTLERFAPIPTTEWIEGTSDAGQQYSWGYIWYSSKLDMFKETSATHNHTHHTTPLHYTTPQYILNSGTSLFQTS